MTKNFKIAFTSTGILLGITGILAGIITYNWNKKQVDIFSLEKPKQLKKVAKLNISEKLKINKEAFLKKQETNLSKAINLESAAVKSPLVIDQVKLEKIQDKMPWSIDKAFSSKFNKTDILKWITKNPYKTAGIVLAGVSGATLLAISGTFFVSYMAASNPDDILHGLALFGFINKEKLMRRHNSTLRLEQ
ncbi:hypothetical protein QLQ80_01975 [Mycoplasma sp. M5725]|uniref:Uncharacterized protein n=1 Tax=Mycoplasma phocimorsus TaxID=3045839 RepID=A0AAJ1UVS6_9MOLU|nr:hypothetical protein [Mycoplasma phocimorsus]MDJ1645854.1 hypothetical protein [Mycoplasma phocimorsus]MDJ1648000.1 hypothetical protein [Mycoplasma phocimorsus]